MYGAIFGDIIGSPYAFDQGKETARFDIFHPPCYTVGKKDFDWNREETLCSEIIGLLLCMARL